MLAFAPDGKSWASAFAVDVRFFEDLREVRRISQMNTAAGSIGFSPDGKTLRLGNHDVNVATGTLAKQPDMPDLAAWASATGLPAPAQLSWPAARKSDDGTLLVVAATGATADRRDGYQEPKTGDRDWVFALDGRRESRWRRCGMAEAPRRSSRSPSATLRPAAPCACSRGMR
jgi:hypothetical protein